MYLYIRKGGGQMNTVSLIEKRREEILEEMGAMRSLRRGTINEQYFRAGSKRAREGAMRGPYYVLSRNEGGKTRSRRLTSREQLEQTRRDVAAHKRFKHLCSEYAELTERLGELERQMGGQSPVKKGLKSRSRKTRK
jgi:hypothetical protein